MDTKILLDFISFCNTKIDVKIGTICGGLYGEGELVSIDGNKATLYHYHKQFEQVYWIKDIMSEETNLSKHGIKECYLKYIELTKNQ